MVAFLHGTYWTPAEHSHSEDVLARLRRELAPSTFEAAFARGRTMLYEDVVEFLLSELDRLRTSTAKP